MQAVPPGLSVARVVSGVLPLVLVGVWAAATTAQQPPTFRTGVDMVTLGVRVADLLGDRPVDGLTAADFRVLEDGQPQTVSLVTHERRPVSLCIVLDASGSMTFELRRDLARLVTDTLLRGLDGGDEVAAVVFRDRVEVRQPWTRVAALTSLDWGDAPSGGTALVDGVRTALTLLDSARNPRRAVVVITDGVENSSRTSLASLTTTRRQSEAVIYGVAIGNPEVGQTTGVGPTVPVDFERGVVPDVRLQNSGRSTSALVQPPEVTSRPPEGTPPPPVPQPNLIESLVGEAGGVLLRARSSVEATQAARNIVADLATQYTLGYVPSKPADGTYRRVRVDVARRGLFVRHRAGYLAIRAAAPVTPPPVAPRAPSAPDRDPAVTASVPARGTARPTTGGRFTAYAEAVQAFMTERRFDRVERLIGGWTRDELSAAVADAVRMEDAELAREAAVFHLEVALTAALRSPENAEYHLDLGARMLAPLAASRTPDTAAFLERWHAAAVSVFLAQSDRDRARRVAGRAAAQVPQAARTHFMAGRIEELEAMLYDVDLARDDGSAIAFNAERRLGLALAERAYREALRRDPRYRPAALHLGRVLFLLDRYEDARQTLEPIVADAGAAPAERYLASLFLAAEYERADEVARARATLEAIDGFAPGRPAARLALAALEHRAGRVDRARAVASAGMSEAYAPGRDEWWAYRNGGLQEEDLEWLRAAVPAGR